jgi:hypothetical protein
MSEEVQQVVFNLHPRATREDFIAHALNAWDSLGRPKQFRLVTIPKKEPEVG